MRTDSPQPHPESTAAIVLLHTLADGSSHFDWMIERPGIVDGHRLMTFRVGDRPDQWGGDSGREEQLFHGEQLGDHRAHYLRFEGDIGGGRGVVQRVALGRCIRFELSEAGDGLVFEVLWESGGGGRYLGTRDLEAGWRFRCQDLDSHP